MKICYKFVLEKFNVLRVYPKKIKKYENISYTLNAVIKAIT